MSKPSILGVAGSLSTPSSSRRLIDLTIGRIGDRIGRTAAETRVIEVAGLRALAVHARGDADAELEGALRAVETADLLVVGTPVYKGSYTGLFKHFIDLIDYRALIGTPVALLATGGSDRHALVIEHQLRPLFAFFQAQALGTGLFLTGQDFAEGRITNPAIDARLDRLVEEAVSALSTRSTASARGGSKAA